MWPHSYSISFKDKAVQSLQGHDSCTGAEWVQSGYRVGKPSMQRPRGNQKEMTCHSSAGEDIIAKWCWWDTTGFQPSLACELGEDGLVVVKYRYISTDV